MKQHRFLLFLFLHFFVIEKAYSHGDEKHEESVEKPKENIEVTAKQKEALKLVSDAYTKNVEGIFQKKCMDCHAKNNDLPWYSVLPIAKGIINNDVKEAKKHLDMTEGFPFKGHGYPVGDLKAIKESIQMGIMPPLRYRVLHWNSALTKDEKNLVEAWIVESINNLKSFYKEKKSEKTND